MELPRVCEQVRPRLAPLDDFLRFRPAPHLIAFSHALQRLLNLDIFRQTLKSLISTPRFIILYSGDIQKIMKNVKIPFNILQN